MLLKFASASVKRFHIVFLLHELGSRVGTFAGLEKSDERFDTPKNLLFLWEKHLYRKMCLASTYSGLKTLRQVSLYLSDLEMNWTPRFHVQGDKLAIVLHLLLAPEGTVVKPAEHEVVRRLSSIPGAS